MESEWSEQRHIAARPPAIIQSVRKALEKCRKNPQKTLHLSMGRPEKLPILPLLFICRYIRCLLTTPDSLAILSLRNSDVADG